MRALAPPAAPRGLRRFLLRLPLLAYRAGVGFVYGHRLLLLTHTGRRSGQPRQTVLEVVAHDGDAVTVASGYGRRSDWYRNLLATPEATIALGRHRHRVTAHPLTDAYRVIWHYAAGEITARGAAARRREDERPTYQSQVFAGLDPATLPRLAELGDRWEELTARETFDKGVRAIVRGLL